MCEHPQGKVMVDWDYADGTRTPFDVPTEQVLIDGVLTTRLKPNVVQEWQCLVCNAKEVVRP